MTFGDRQRASRLKRHDVGSAASSGHGGQAAELSSRRQPQSRLCSCPEIQYSICRFCIDAATADTPKPHSKSTTPSSQTQPLLFSSSSAITPSVRTVKALRIRPTAELGLLSLLFVLSAAFAAVFSVAILCIPTINAMRRLAVAVGKLSNVVSREVPGTLYSLKLSGVEINDLAKQLAALREQISTTGFGKNSE